MVKRKNEPEKFVWELPAGSKKDMVRAMRTYNNTP